MKKTGVILIAVLMLFTASCGKSYEAAEAAAEKYIYEAAEAAAEKYIYEAYGKEGNIVKTEFYHYDEGITGGMYQYGFTFLRSDGVIEKYAYHSYSDITEVKITEHIFEQIE